jgi:hypothetical protein
VCFKADVQNRSTCVECATKASVRSVAAKGRKIAAAAVIPEEIDESTDF